ncbi:hypothetical protein [Amycolatopsis eburnea]|uniref:Uncharacterized protein n=1 Tax=Amycolatopsis eburnea TaxID=2267691 RepID=A0A3R9E577_9PSEU|nr:hypothetical protein [Amycolatopsis eburnea]RSD26387.1 hypothetical protein EIY87_00550 [Amycolatopsis eburnea]
MFRVVGLGLIVIAGVVTTAALAARHHRAVAVTERDLEALSVVYASAYDEGRLTGMAEAFDVIAADRQTQPR